MHERDDFEPYDTQEDQGKVDVQLREADGRLRVSPESGPCPPWPRRPPAVRLAPGQWVRRQLNYRFSGVLGIRDWSYWLNTFDIAYGPVSADVFLSTPTVFVDEQGPLRQPCPERRLRSQTTLRHRGRPPSIVLTECVPDPHSREQSHDR